MKADPRFIDLAMTILKTEPVFEDDPNGPYRYYCPLCYRSISFGGTDEPEKNYAMRALINHTPDCPWGIANALAALTAEPKGEEPR